LVDGRPFNGGLFFERLSLIFNVEVQQLLDCGSPGHTSSAVPSVSRGTGGEVDVQRATEVMR
jgi:hypothetical protein